MAAHRASRFRFVSCLPQLALQPFERSGNGVIDPPRPLRTAIAFSAGSFVLAPIAVPLALRFGRLVLVAGAVLMAAGIAGVDVGAHHVGASTSPRPLVPGLAVAGAGWPRIRSAPFRLARIPAHGHDKLSKAPNHDSR